MGGNKVCQRQASESDKKHPTYQPGLVLLIIMTSICGGFKEVDNFMNC